MLTAAAHSHAARTLLGASLALGLSGCDRVDEGALRARLEQWFAVGEAYYFAASSACAVAVYKLVDDQVRSAMPVTHAVPEMLYTLPRQGRAALDDPRMAPDAALVDLANANRSLGMAMRRAGLEARDCMDDRAEGTFRRALLSPATLLAYEGESGTMVLMDRDAGLLLAVMGEG